MSDRENGQTTQPRATMQDVARAAGVSLKSVSRVINAEPHVSQKLLDKVQAAIHELRYVPDTAARSLAGQRHFMLGVLLDNPSPHYTMRLVAGAYEACRQHRYTLQFDNIYAAEGPGHQAERIEQILHSSRLDGMILTPPTSDVPELLDSLERKGLPYVRIAPGQDTERSARVTVDDRDAVRQVADYFWERGHRRFGLVRGLWSHPSSRIRRDAFVERLRSHSPDVSIIEADGDYTFEGGLRAGEELLSARRPATAVFASNDDGAAGVMTAAMRLGLKVPHDVSVIGFDDSWVAKSVWPSLTTVRQPLEEMGHAAAQMLISRALGGHHGTFANRHFEHRFIERGTVRTIA
ncbi:LacI family DNA-binding transcriptional regulator [Novosphingobium profundi]|uniref:LacI family DNA-binding transcriptional regulator n=1 Tax=Novosphingobium profundi TaxID=1774954 RepID=UPI001BDB33B5|nr:LacI family DNA-binding transcriptional regulator [Novosphingobium profundi]MBT0670514.1 LacI family DNA-binding transcriptional regulator [Novosphingobium profundi]